MGESDFNAKEQQRIIESICKDVIQQFKGGNSKKAAEILKRGLARYPENKYLIKLLNQLKEKVRDKKVQKLEDEAIVLMQQYATDKAQEKLREILRLDPSRTDLKASLNNLKSEVQEQYDTSMRKQSIKRIYLVAGFTVFAVIMIFCISIAFSNRKHIKDAEDCIVHKDYAGAVEAFNKCGWFMAGKKSAIVSELQSARDELTESANLCVEKEEYKKAVKLLKTALTASFDPNEFDDKIENYTRLDQQKIAALAKKIEAEKKAIEAKRLCTGAAQKARSNGAHIYSTKLWQEAGKMCGDAQKLLEAKEFAQSKNTWVKALRKYEKASGTAIVMTQDRNASKSAREKCNSIREIAIKMNAETEAGDLWEEANKLCILAAKNSEDKEFTKANQGWRLAEGKYNEALDVARQSPSYQEAQRKIYKWGRLKKGMTLKELGFLGKVKYAYVTSEKCIQYYQDLPVYTTEGNRKGHVITAGSGTVYLNEVGLETALGKVKSVYDLKCEKENRIYGRDLELLEGDRRAKRVSLSESGSIKRQMATKHGSELSVLKQKYDTARDKLTSGITLYEPVYVVSRWVLPESDGVRSLLCMDGLLKKEDVEPVAKWQFPANWGRLTFNMDKELVIRIMGDSESIKSAANEIVIHYGNVPGYAVLVFKKRNDRKFRLSSWEEPFWPTVFEGLSIASEKTKDVR